MDLDFRDFLIEQILDKARKLGNKQCLLWRRSMIRH